MSCWSGKQLFFTFCRGVLALELGLSLIPTSRARYSGKKRSTNGQPLNAVNIRINSKWPQNSDNSVKMQMMLTVYS